MANNIDIGRTLETSLPTDGSGITGKVYLTDKQNMYVIDNNKNKLKITDIIPVNILPSVGQTFKIYILNSSGTYTMNIYDGSWHTLTGGSDQILKGTISPTDTSKLWLDINNINSPVLKFYNGTSWLNISSSISINDNTKSTTATYSSDKIVSLIDNQGDYNTSYSYNGDGKISGYAITGDKIENVVYTYFASGDNIGKIETETIVKDGKTLVNTFSYTNGKISGITTVTN